MNYNTTFLVVKSSPVYSDVCGKVYKNGIELYGKAEIFMKQEPIRHFPWILFLRNIQHMEMVTIVSMVWRQSRRTEVTLQTWSMNAMRSQKANTASRDFRQCLQSKMRQKHSKLFWKTMPADCVLIFFMVYFHSLMWSQEQYVWKIQVPHRSQ